MAVKIGGLIVTLSAITDGFDKGLTQAERGLNKFARKTDNLRKAALGTGLAITGALGAAVVQAGKFQNGIAETATLGVKDLDKLSTAIKDVSVEYGLQLPDAVKAAYQAISAGISENDAPGILKASAMAAKAGVSDLTTAIDLGTNVINAFGKSASDMESVFDQAFIAVKEGKTTFDELGASVGRVSPLFAAAGLSSEEMFASIATLTKGGIATSEAVSGLKAALSNIIKPSDAALASSEELGVSFGVQALQAKGLQGLLVELQGATGGNVEKMADFFGSVEALNAVLALTGPQASEFNRIVGEMGKSAGATKTAFDKWSEGNLSFLWDQLRTTLNVLAVDIGTVLLPALADVTKYLVDVVKAVREFQEEHPTLFSNLIKGTALFGGLSLAIGGALQIIRPLATVLGGIKTAFNLVGGAGTVATGATKLFGLGVAALGTPVAGILGTAVLAIGAFWLAWQVGSKIIGPILQPVFDKLYGWITGSTMRLNQFASEVEAAAHRAEIAMEGAARAKSLLDAGATRSSDEEWSRATGRPASERPALPRHARGGIARGGLALVGERGPEVVAMPRGSRVMPHDEMRALVGGGVTVNVHINGSVNDRSDIDSLARRVGREVAWAMSGRGSALPA